MRITARGRHVVVALVLTGATSAGATAHLWNPYARECRTVDLAEDIDGAGDDRAVELLAHGWFGDPSDHAERLYAPACRR